MRKYIWIDANCIDFDKYLIRKSYNMHNDKYVFLVDRFNLLKGELGIDTKNVLSQVPPSFGKQMRHDYREYFFEVMDEISNKVFQRIGDRTLYLMYSGGLDSVCVLAALERNPKFKQLNEEGRFVVSMNNSSIMEYPHLFYNHIVHKYNIVPTDYNSLMLDNNAFIVTGDGGDFIASDPDSISVFDPSFDLMSSPALLLGSRKETTTASLYVNKLYKESQKRCPFEIKSSNQLLWWTAQSFSCQDEYVRPYKWSTLDDFSELTTDKKVFRWFFDNMMYKFSYEYVSTNPKIQNFEQSRNFSKDYVVNHFKDESYYSKPKIYSQRKVYRRKYKSSVFVEDGKIGYTTNWDLVI